MKIGFAGIGKIGATLARLFAEQHVHIGALYNRSPQVATNLAHELACEAVTAPVEVVRRCDVSFLTVSDDAIHTVVHEIVASDISLTNKYVVHTSGVHDLSVLQPIIDAGGVVGGLHPAYPFANSENADLTGVTFAIEATDLALQALLRSWSELLGGHVIIVPPGMKPLYHASLVVASNYAITLFSVAEHLLKTLSDDTDAVQHTLLSLFRVSLDNIERYGTVSALTGPIVRGDTGTIQKHLAVLDQKNPEIAELYRLLGHHTLPIAALQNKALHIELVRKELRRLNHDDHSETKDRS